MERPTSTAAAREAESNSTPAPPGAPGAPGGAGAPGAPGTPGAPAAWAAGRRLAERALDHPSLPVVILLGALLLTALAWGVTRHIAEEDGRGRFERRTDDIQRRIEGRLASSEALLRGGVALLAAQPDVDRDAWHRYVRTLNPQPQFPGILGLGLAQLSSPTGPRDLATAQVMLESFDGHDRQTLGMDWLSAPMPHEAMQRAVDSGRTAMSGIVTLGTRRAFGSDGADGHEGADAQPGALVLLPVFRPGVAASGAAPGAPVQWGWVFAPLRVGDLMAGVLGRLAGEVAFRLHDGPSHAVPAFYDSESTPAAQGPTGAAKQVEVPHRTLERAFDFGGRRWTVVYEGRSAAADAGAWPPYLVAACGLSISLALYGSVVALSRRKRKFQRQAARHSAESEARLASLNAVSGLSPDAVLVFDLEADGVYRLALVNPIFSEWFCQAGTDLTGLSEQQINEWLAGVVAEREGALERPLLAAGETLVVLPLEPRRVLHRGIRESGRQRVYYLRDVTHEIEVDRLKTEFLATAAHELRTPLATVYGYAELLHDAKLAPARTEKVVGVIFRQAGVLKHLVEELLDLARLDSRNGTDFLFESTDLRELAEQAAESLRRPEAPECVHLVLPATPVRVQADVVKLRQAVVNLLSNALKYSAEGGSAVLRVQALAVDGAPRALIEVEDQGIGMTPEQAARAFERFYRADPSGHVSGAGLGLSIVKEIVTLHGGNIDLRSTWGHGTTVSISLPLEHFEGAQAPSPGAAPSQGAARSAPALQSPVPAPAAQHEAADAPLT